MPALRQTPDPTQTLHQNDVGQVSPDCVVKSRCRAWDGPVLDPSATRLGFGVVDQRAVTPWGMNKALSFHFDCVVS